MSQWKQLVLKQLVALPLPPERVNDIAEELAQHLEAVYDAALCEGATEAEAQAAALQMLADAPLLECELSRVEQTRVTGWLPRAARVEWLERSGGTPMGNWTQDLRCAVRRLKKTPGFTVTALLTLALCLGANLSIFAVVDAVLLRALPFPDADRLVLLYNTYPKAGVEGDGSSLTNYYERRGQLPAFAALAICREESAIVGAAGATERTEIMRVSPEFFAMLGVSPGLGRTFKEEETSYETDNVVLLSDAYWRQHFQATPQVLGQTLRVDGTPKTIVGVLPPEFRFLSSTARLYFPLASAPTQRVPAQRHSGSSIKMIARLNPGVRLTEAQAQVDAHNALVERSNPQAKMMAEAGFRSLVVPLHGQHVAAVRPTLWLMQAGVLLLLLIGGVNLVNLLLIRASTQNKELAIRQALGARRGHIVSQVLSETVLLSVGGGLLGLVVAAGGIRLLAVLGADPLPLGAQLTFDGRLALAGLGGTLLLSLLLGLPVAAFNLHVPLATALHAESRSGTASRAAQRWRHGFIVAQIALAFVLLAGAGLLGLSFKRVLALAPGFQTENILSGRLSLPRHQYPGWSERVAFTETLTAELEGQPGVAAAGMVTALPFSGQANKSALMPQGYVPVPGESVRGHYLYGVAGNYFSALEIPLRAGRWLDGADVRRATRVCVVDEDFARRYWPQGDALGKRLFLGSRPQPEAEAFTIVGIVGAVKQLELTEASAQGAVYFPYKDVFDDSVYVVVRTSVPPELFGANLAASVRRINADLPVSDLRTMATRVRGTLLTRQVAALLFSLFAGVALLLTAIGTYGVLSYAVSQRYREIGIRLALGAPPRQVTRQFLALGARLLALGTLLGGGGAWLAARLMQNLLFNVPALPWLLWSCAAAVLATVALLACWLPARRAAQVDPLTALRME